MSGQLILRTVAVAASAALLLGALGSPTLAAKPKCAGKVATIVGTKKGEVIRGTAKRDVIVARGGHDRIFAGGGNDIVCAGLGNDRVVGGRGIDRIYGQAGRDKLYGGRGPDFLAGQVGNDTLVGGQGIDACHQGPGTGPRLRCERPLAAPPPVVAPAPPGPAPIPEGFKKICEEDHGGTAVAGGTYDGVDAGPLAPVCEWDDITPTDWTNASADINSFCNQVLNTSTSGKHYQDGSIPDGIWGCDVYSVF